NSGLGLITTEYDRLVEAQIKFNRVNQNIDTNGLLQLEDMYDRLNEQLRENSDLSNNEKKLYQEQLNIVQEAIEKKKDERKSLEDIAIQYGFNEKELGNYSDRIQDYTNKDLQEF